MYCKHCGKKIDDDSSFCAFCGKELSSTVLNHDDQHFDSSTNTSVTEINCDSNKSRKIVITIIKEVCFIALFGALSLGISCLGMDIFKNIYEPPIVSEEKQQEFNDSIYYRSRPLAYEDLTYDEYRAEIKRQLDVELKNPKYYKKFDHTPRAIYSVGDILPLIKFGEWKYDESIPASELQYINDRRKSELNIRARELQDTLLKSLFIALVTIRFIYLLIRWLRKKE